MKLRTVGYFCREAVRSLRHNLSIASLGTVTVSLLILGVFLLTIMNLIHVARVLESQVGIRVFLKDDVSRYVRESLKARLEAIDGIEKIVFVNRETALKQMKEWLGDNKAILNIVERNPLPDGFEIRVRDPGIVKSLAVKVRAMEGVEGVNYGEEVVEKFLAVTRVVSAFTWAFALLLSVGVIFIISNTIKLTVFARRREIEIMKLVGATDWFIRWPFLIEGMLVGFAGAFISAVVLYYSYYMIVSRVFGPLPFIPLVTDPGSVIRVCFLLAVLGIGTGAMGGGISMKRFLHV